MKIQLTRRSRGDRRIGLDTESVPQVNWPGPPIWKHPVAIGWGTEKNLHYIESYDTRPGCFDPRELMWLREELMADNVIVVGHNVGKADLDLVNGLLIWHDLPMLPELRCQDTMNTLKTGYAFRNSLRKRCEHYGIQLKQGSPDWDDILKGFPWVWWEMREYNMNDVVCALQLERTLDKAGLACPVQIWRPRKTARW